MKTVTVTSRSDDPVVIRDLGIIVPRASSIQISDYCTEKDIRTSANLKALVQSGELRIEGLEPEQKVWSTFRR